jgi:16S rRNA (cytidine1402-2'-O)-methyltransferase
MTSEIGTLFLVGTPIGNLGDLTDRARRILGEVDLVAAEDTRRTGRLLAQIGVKVRLVSFFAGNEAERTPQLVAELHAGHDVAVVTDAGMPSISDPGYRLVAACVEAGIAVDVVPGPSAALAALVVSGLPTDRFVFEGFLPRSGRDRAARLQAMEDEPRTIVLFESPRRTAATLADLASRLGADRRAVVARELTKLHQEVLRGTVGELALSLTGRELKGEVVLVLEGVGTRASIGLGEDDEAEAYRLAQDLVASGMRKREAARRAGAQTGVPGRTVYEALVRGPAETPH